jgi:hypothetical protein
VAARNEPDPDQEPVRTEEQEVAGGVADETPAAVLFSVIGIVVVLVLVALAVAALAYWLA